MAHVTLAYAAYLDAVAEEVARFADLARAHPTSTIAACDGCSLDGLAWLAAGVCRRWATQVVVADPEAFVSTDDPPRRGDGALALEVEATHLIQVLEEKGPQSPCWNWSDEEFTTTWVARRMALESVLHRVDAEFAVGSPHEVERELAIDGIDERLEVHLRVALEKDPELHLGGTLCLVCSDDAAAWVVGFDHGCLRWRHGRGPADAALVGRASDLLLYAWNRAQAGTVELTGSGAVAQAWRSLPC